MGLSQLAKINQAELAKKHNDMAGKSIMIQSEATADDVENVELFHTPGVLCVPAHGDDSQLILVEIKRGRIAIAHHDYRIEIALEEGETAVYSTNADGEVKAKTVYKSNGDIEMDANDSAKITLKNDGNIEINGNSKHFVTHEDLTTALSTFATSGIGHTHNITAPGSPSGPAVGFPSFDISAAKTNTIKTGG